MVQKIDKNCKKLRKKKQEKKRIDKNCEKSRERKKREKMKY